MNDDLKKIHDASMRILEKSGMIFHHPGILKLLEQKGIKVSGETAFFTREQVMEWVSKAPRRFRLFARNPKYDFVLGDNHIEFAPGYGAPNILERDGSKRSAVLSDHVQFLKLVHQSDKFKVNGGILVEPSDLDPQYNYPVMLYYNLTHSDKFIFGMEGKADQVNMTMDMIGAVFGDRNELIKQPRIMTIVNTLSPLRMDQTALDTMLIYASNGQPVIITPAAMAGFTGPITLAGLIALSNAETLAGIAVTQMIRKGTPVVYGCQSTAADMRSGAYVVGNPEHVLCLSYAAKLAKAYGLPCRGGGAPSDAKQLSVQSGYESMMILLTSCRENINYIIHSAGIIDSFSAMSFDKFIVDLEIIDMVERIGKGVRIDDETLAVDIIREIGPGGQYMTSEHTVKLCRQEPWNPEIGLKGMKVSKDPNSDILDNILKKKEKMLSAYQQPHLPQSIASALTDYLQSKGVDKSLLFL
ncbi:MAG TPA: trimethylamine methyltransferase [Deltaproteobacteria bacterium]|nr:trimethylamine methyltransferase [Deltaproteobacteria bacterium]